MDEIATGKKKIGNVVDDMGEAIAMLKFMTTAMIAITSNKTLNDQESFGLQQIYFHIENRFEKSFECLNELSEFETPKKAI